MKYSIVTPIFNKSDITEQYLSKLLPQLGDNQLIIVDNNSKDNTLDVVDFYVGNYRNSDIDYIKSSSNLGFAGGNNLGMKVAKHEIIVCMSNDVLVEGDISVFSQCLPKQLCGARLITFDTGWNKFVDKDPIRYLEGWCIWSLRSNWEELGYWDTRYFTDYEDLDLSYSAHQKSYTLSSYPVSLTHLGGQTAITLPEGRLKYTLESQRKFCEKWHLII